ncbi:MAG: hypothetical protein H6863_05725 [Rhodospirillales bacterium]|nr:hypothetical protein [Rhodospirillales bacterium]
MDIHGAQTYLYSLQEAYRLHYEAAQRRFPASLIRMSGADAFAQIAGLRRFAGIKQDLLQAAATIAHPDAADMILKISPHKDTLSPEAAYRFEQIRQKHRLYAAVPEELLTTRENLRQRGYIMLGHAQDSRRHEKTGLAQQLIKAAMSNGRIESDTPMSHAEKVFENARRISELQAKALDLPTPYDANLVDFTPGVDVATYAPLLESLFEDTILLRDDVLAQQEGAPAPLPLPEFSVEQGQKLVRLISDLLPIDDPEFETHVLRGLPSMCMGDIATIRFSPNPLTLAETTFHERIAHLSYRYNSRNMGGILGFHMDEARALSMERFFLREYPVLQHLSEIMTAAFGTFHDAFHPDNLSHHVNFTSPDISDRTASDDLTYILQETVRSRAELYVMNGGLKVAEMPDFMAAETERAFHLHNLNGYHIMRETFQWPLCMQGHLVAYPLGLIIGATLHHAAKRVLGDRISELGRGAQAPYFQFMADYVDGYGDRKSLRDLLNAAAPEAGFLDLRPLYSSLEQKRSAAIAPSENSSLVTPIV